MKKTIGIGLVILMWAGMASAFVIGDAVEVSVISDHGNPLLFYPVRIHPRLKKVYAEATKGDYYRIVIRNKLSRRVGVVIAVDGRNIISGQKSRLQPTERMYVIEAYGANEFSGWRTGQHRVNRFYFTEVPDSYAAAFGDESAMGVIAVAVYPEEKPCFKRPPQLIAGGRMKEGAKEKAAAPAVRDRSDALESAGTGYGFEEYSPSYSIEFRPERSAVESILIKYEWRETLCRMGVADCSKKYSLPFNRLWDENGYAPPPPCCR